MCCLLDAGFSGAGPTPDECLTPDHTQHLTVFNSVRQKERDVYQRHMGSEEPTPAKRASACGHRCGSKWKPPLSTWTQLQEREGLEGACCCPLRTRPLPSARTRCPGSTCLTEETSSLQTTCGPAPRGARRPSEGRAPAEAPSGWATGAGSLERRKTAMAGDQERLRGAAALAPGLKLSTRPLWETARVSQGDQLVISQRLRL